jgi:hypothetical protein
MTSVQNTWHTPVELSTDLGRNKPIKNELSVNQFVSAKIRVYT